MKKQGGRQEQRQERRASAGKSAGESFAATLQDMQPGCETTLLAPEDKSAPPTTVSAIRGFDAVFLGGSPLHINERSSEIVALLDFMASVFASGTPSFGSCAGLQIAVTAAGGSVRKIEGPREAGIARRILRAPDGVDHPLLAGRPAVWDAATIHGDEVADLPAGARLLATNANGLIHAVEIRHDRGVFWGVQYHPELAPGEIAAALRRSTDTLCQDRLARDREDVEAQAALFERLHREPDDLAARWRLGVDGEYAEQARRRRELRNFIDHLEQLRHGG